MKYGLNIKKLFHSENKKEGGEKKHKFLYFTIEYDICSNFIFVTLWSYFLSDCWEIIIFYSLVALCIFESG